MVTITASVAWETESPFLDVDYEERNHLGAPTLKHLATKKILSDQRNLEQEHFRHVPWAIAKQLWQYLARSGKRTLHMWKIFCTVYPDHFRQVSQHCKSAVRSPWFPLTAYIDMVQSPACSWATSLNVWTEFARVPELVKLADVTNLVSLEINTSVDAHDEQDEEKEVNTLNDRVIRTWCELAETSRAFRHLRVLRLYGQRELTGQSFCYLARLPSLEYCVVAMCDRMTERSSMKMANSQGWFVESQGEEANHAMCQFSSRDCSKAFDGQKEWHARHPDDLIPPSLSKDISLLEFSVGQKHERLKDRDVIIFHRKLDSHSLLAKGHKRGLDDTPKDDGGPKKAKKPVMKQRSKDLSGMLAEFV